MCGLSEIRCIRPLTLTTRRVLAKGDGGGVSIDASSDTSDGTLTSPNASSTFLCGNGGAFIENKAGERGGALYVTRESKAVWRNCSSSRNTASLGAALYSSHAMVQLLDGSKLSNDDVSRTLQPFQSHFVLYNLRRVRVMVMVSRLGLWLRRNVRGVRG